MKVLMIGPGKGKPGGILALIEALVPVLAEQVELCYFPTVKRLAPQEMGVASWRNVGLALRQYGRFLRTLWQFRPDLIHLHTSQGLGWFKDTFYIAVSKLGRYPLVLHIHAAEFDQLYGKQSRLRQWYTRQMMRRADAVIAVSDGWREALANLVPSERIFTFRPCLSINGFTSRPAAVNGTVKGLFLGTIGPRKGAFDLLAASHSLQSQGTPFHLWLAGGEERHGDLSRAQAQLAALKLEDSCELVGIVQGEEKAQLLRDAHLFVLPSHNEGLPFAIIEAMAAGLPVVATAVGGIPEVVKDGYNGFLIPPGDVPVLAEKLGLLTADPQLRHTMGQRSRQIAEQELDVKPYVQRLLALYKKLEMRNGK
jgi:glycosyltransferase involved in cell wall biosynthesis